MVRRAWRSALTLLVCLLSFELATRLDQWARFGTPPWSPIAKEEDLLTRDSLGEHGKPYAQYQKWALNNLGMRGPDVSINKPSNAFRIVTAGASETFGLYESPHREYPRQLEDSLRADFQRKDCRDVLVEVVNAAIFGMSLPSIDHDLAVRVALIHPDVVVLYPTPVQYLADGVPRAAPAASAGDDPAEPWYAVLRPRSFSILRQQLKQDLPRWLRVWMRERDINWSIANRPRTWRFATVPTDRLSMYDQDLRHIISTVRKIGAVPILMTHANLFMTATPASSPSAFEQLTSWQLFYPRATGSVLMAFDSAAVSTTLRAARDSLVTVVDLADIVRGMPAGNASRVFADYAHFTDAGSALIAGQLARAVIRAREPLLGCRGAPRVIVTSGRQEQGR
jgi:hypothetical protein